MFRKLLGGASIFALTCGIGISAAHAAGTVEIGMITDLTGPAALSGHHKVDGAQLAVDEINARGGINGKKIKLLIEDDRGQNQAAVSAFQRLVANPDVVAIIGSIRSNITQAMMPYIAKDQVPTMIGGTDPKLTQMGNKWVFRFRPNDDYAAATMAKYAVEDMKSKKVAILYDTDAFGSSGNALLDAALKKDGADVVSDQGYTTATVDYTSYLEKIRSSGADTLATYMTNAEDEAQMLKQLRQLGLKIKIIGSTSIATAVCIQLAGPAVNGTYGVTDFLADGNDEAKAFNKLYEAKYHMPSDVFGGWAYDAINVLSQVIAKDGTSNNAIRNGILAVKGYKGVEGVYTFDEKGDGLHGYWVVKLENQKAVPIKYVD